MHLLARLMGQRRHGDVVGFLVAHQHLGLNAAVVERVHESVGSEGGAARPFAGIDNQNSHWLIIFHKVTVFYRNDNDIWEKKRKKHDSKLIVRSLILHCA